MKKTLAFAVYSMCGYRVAVELVRETVVVGTLSSVDARLK